MFSKGGIRKNRKSFVLFFGKYLLFFFGEKMAAKIFRNFFRMMGSYAKRSETPSKRHEYGFGRNREKMNEESYFWKQEKEQLKALKEKIKSEDGKENKQTNK